MTSNVFSSITTLSELFKGILLDANGVFWGGNEVGVLPGAKELMEKLVLLGKVVGILSNSTQMASKELLKFEKSGLEQGKHFHFLVTSGEVARSIFLNEKLPFEGNKFWVFGAAHPSFSSHEAIFQGTSYSETSVLDDANFVYVGIPHIEGIDQQDPEVFRDVIQKLKIRNLPMVCTNPDLFAHEGKPSRAVVRQGSIARIYEELGGQVFYIGKPHSRAYSATMNHFHRHNVLHAKTILMVGDTPETDIRGARSYGMSTALVTQTGVMADKISHQGFEAALKTILENDTPDYLIGRFEYDIQPAP